MVPGLHLRDLNKLRELCNGSTKFLSVFDDLLTMNVLEVAHVLEEGSGGMSSRSFRSKENTTSSFSQLQTCPEIAELAKMQSSCRITTLKAEVAELAKMEVL